MDPRPFSYEWRKGESLSNHMDPQEIAEGIFFYPHSSPGILSRDRTEDHIFRAAAEGRTFHKYTHVVAEAQKRIEKPLDGEKVR